MVYYRYNKKGDKPMKTYNIINTDNAETAVFHVAEKESFLDRLEETLYITQELEPYFRDWKTHLATFGWADFSYHCAEFFRVSYGWNNQPIEVKPIDYPVNRLEQ